MSSFKSSSNENVLSLFVCYVLFAIRFNIHQCISIHFSVLFLTVNFFLSSEELGGINTNSTKGNKYEEEQHGLAGGN
jgi:hypothetical protein